MWAALELGAGAGGRPLQPPARQTRHRPGTGWSATSVGCRPHPQPRTPHGSSPETPARGTEPRPPHHQPDLRTAQAQGASQHCFFVLTPSSPPVTPTRHRRLPDFHAQQHSSATVTVTRGGTLGSPQEPTCVSIKRGLRKGWGASRAQQGRRDSPANWGGKGRRRSAVVGGGRWPGRLSVRVHGAEAGPGEAGGVSWRLSGVNSYLWRT